MKRLVPVVFLIACDAANGDDTPVEKHGHEALLGGTWTTTALEEGDVRIDLGFTFDLDSAVVSSDCHAGERSLHVEVETPVEYWYTVTAQEAGAAGTIACGITLAEGRYDFQIVGDRINVFAGDLQFTLARAGQTDGLFGTWSTPTDDGSLSWTFAANAVRVSRLCTAVSSEPVILTVPAETRGFIKFLEGHQDTAEDGDFECKATVNAELAGYSFDGDALVITSDGDEVTLRR